jgi:hypothetical protein
MSQRSRSQATNRTIGDIFFGRSPKYAAKCNWKIIFQKKFTAKEKFISLLQLFGLKYISGGMSSNNGDWQSFAFRQKVILNM